MSAAARQHHVCVLLAYPLIEMRPLKINPEEVGRDNQLMGKNSLVPTVQELWNAWNTWEIQCLILVSFSLQVFLLLFADLRRRSSSSVLRTVMWLAYLSADSVAIFVLGHLAVRESGPRHELMPFWAPFVLIHLGGQDTITAFSKQDNELWRRHLLSLVSQAAVAGYVVAKASWPDRRIKAATVLIYLSGCFKYAERTICLWVASPAKLRSIAISSLQDKLRRQAEEVAQAEQPSRSRQQPKLSVDRAKIESIRKKECESMEDKLGTMLSIASVRTGLLCTETIQAHGLCEGPLEDRVTSEIMSVDAPLNQLQTILIADDLPRILEDFRSREDHCFGAYAYVGEGLVRSYRSIFTKTPFREGLCSIIEMLCDVESQNLCLQCLQCLPGTVFLLCNIFFAHISTPIALKLFMAARKDHQSHLHDASGADVAVSCILLVGAVVIDVFAAARCFFHCCVQRLPWNIKLWSEQLAQYSMIRRYARTVSAGSMRSHLRQWVRRRLGAWGARFFDVTHTPVAPSMKEFILDNLLASGVRKEWNIASTRGQLALSRHQAAAGGGPDHQSGSSSSPTMRAVARSISGDVDFPTSVLIWHIATEMCYYFTDDHATASPPCRYPGDPVYQAHLARRGEIEKHKEMSRELSNYIMYLVFKRGVMLTSNSQLVHDKVHQELREGLTDEAAGSSQSQQGTTLGEKDAAMKLFTAKKEEQEALTTQQQNLQTVIEIPKLEELVDSSNPAANHLRKLLQSTEDLYSPLLPRAYEVAQELLSIGDEADRWRLIAEVWSEMLYYTAPRCGGGFHYERLSTGGEFVTHVLLLMFHLGPFLPPPGA